MTTTQNSEAVRLTAAVRDYVEAVFREVMRVAANVGRHRDAGDVADEMVAEVLEHPEAIMARYPDPVRYARERVRHCGISLDRRQRVQRGEGARLVQGADGLLNPGRVWISGESTVREGGPSVFSLVRDLAAEFADSSLDRMIASALVGRCCQGLTNHQLFEVLMVDGLGYDVTEVAAVVGQRRETVSRRLNAARRIIRQNRAEMTDMQDFEG